MRNFLLSAAATATALAGLLAQSDCIDCSTPSPFDDLLGTTFHGSIRIPASESAATATDFFDPSPTLATSGTLGQRADYHFAPADVHFEFHGAVAEFNEVSAASALVLVQNCIDDQSTCAGQDDFQWLMFTTANYRYTLGTMLVGGAEGVGIAPLAQLQASEVVTYFTIESLDFNHSIFVDLGGPTSMTVDFTAGASPVPVPGSIALFGLSIATLGLTFSAQRRRR
jgi:hypothetical protein